MAEKTIVHVFWKRVSETPDLAAIMQKIDGEYRTLTWKEHGKVVEEVACGLIDSGLKPADNIAIMSGSRPHWTWADVACVSIGCATVPIYPTLTPLEAEYLLKHSDSVCAFVENEHQARKILDLAELPPALKFLVVMEGEVKSDKLKCVTWQTMRERGAKFNLNNPSTLPQRIEAIDPDSIISIVYTSGTTGVPKGVVLRHSNIYSVCESIAKLVGFSHTDLSLSFLPLSHVYERVGGQFLAIYQGLTMAYAESIETVIKNILEVRPTVLNGVPRFYEKAYQKIQGEIRNLPPGQQLIARWAFGLSRRAARIKSTANGDADLGAKFYKGELRFADKLVYAKIRKRFGGRIRIMISGAAPLSTDVQSFFNTIGLPIVEGYGLTETSAPLSCNTPENNKRGSVGRPLPGVEVKIAEDGEIMVRGPNVFTGYYKNEAATKEVFVDGWFLTGDIGEIDSEGYIKIKDRKKDIIITSGGKHVAPQFVENLFKGERLISNILVYGDCRKFCTALLTLNQEAVESFAASNEIEYKDFAELSQNEKVREEVEKLVARKNDELASFERIKKFVILDRDFTAEEDELTPTFKMKRKAITDKYRKLLDGLYDSSDLELTKNQ